MISAPSDALAHAADHQGLHPHRRRRHHRRWASRPGSRRTALGSRPTAPSTSSTRCSAGCSPVGVDAALEEPLRRVQNDLFHLGSDLCVPEAEKESMPVPRIEARHVCHAGGVDGRLVGRARAARQLRAARRRAGRGVAPGGARGLPARRAARGDAARDEPVGPFAVRYLNRLSDALFVAARYENAKRGVAEPLWDSRK